jgi:hypothetical protein
MLDELLCATAGIGAATTITTNIINFLNFFSYLPP